MKNKIEEEEEKYFNDLLHSGGSLEELATKISNSPKNLVFDKFLKTLIEEERKMRDLGFKLKIYFEYDEEHNNHGIDSMN